MQPMCSQQIDQVSHCTMFFLNLQSQLRLYHWQTKSYARHKASDKLISKIVELSDTFIETFIGATGVRPKAFPEVQHVLQDMSDACVIDYLHVIEDFLIRDVQILVEHNTALESLRDDLLGAVYQALYMFSLSC